MNSKNNPPIEQLMGRAERLVRRCKYCIARAGSASYFLNGEWKLIPSEPHYFGQDVKFSDGLCPECFVNETEKLNKFNLKH